jgi:DNA ligase (NAD+)
LGKQTLNQLIQAGYIRDIPDLFSLKKYRDHLLSLSGWGEKKVSNLLQNIEVVRLNNTHTLSFALLLSVSLSPSFSSFPQHK